MVSLLRDGRLRHEPDEEARYFTGPPRPLASLSRALHEPHQCLLPTRTACPPLTRQPAMPRPLATHFSRAPTTSATACACTYPCCARIACPAPSTCQGLTHGPQCDHDSAATVTRVRPPRRNRDYDMTAPALNLPLCFLWTWSRRRRGRHESVTATSSSR